MKIYTTVLRAMLIVLLAGAARGQVESALIHVDGMT